MSHPPGHWEAGLVAGSQVQGGVELHLRCVKFEVFVKYLGELWVQALQRTSVSPGVCTPAERLGEPCPIPGPRRKVWALWLFQSQRPVVSALPDPPHITTLGPQLPRLGEWRSVTTPFFIIKEYPLYQLGGPQLRVFRTNFFIQLVRPGTVQPEDTVQFRIPMEMTRVDLRNYLERIYNVPVAAVRTRVQHGSNRKRDHRNVRIKKPDYKVAYVQLVWEGAAASPELPT
ncbi:large ribosomal subunit protein uL23m isoform X3 [Ictidomys tridecemlineatus]